MYLTQGKVSNPKWLPQLLNLKRKLQHIRSRNHFLQMRSIFFPVLFSNTFLFPSITIARQTDLQNQYQSSSSDLLTTNNSDEHNQNKNFPTEIKKTRDRYQLFLEISEAKYLHQLSTVHDLFISLTKDYWNDVTGKNIRQNSPYSYKTIRHKK